MTTEQMRSVKACAIQWMRHGRHTTDEKDAYIDGVLDMLYSLLPEDQYQKAYNDVDEALASILFPNK